MRKIGGGSCSVRDWVAAVEWGQDTDNIGCNGEDEDEDGVQDCKRRRI